MTDDKKNDRSKRKIVLVELSPKAYYYNYCPVCQEQFSQINEPKIMK